MLPLTYDKKGFLFRPKHVKSVLFLTHKWILGPPVAGFKRNRSAQRLTEEPVSGQPLWPGTVASRCDFSAAAACPVGRAAEPQPNPSARY